MKCIDFYKKIVKFLDKKAKAQGVTDLEKYYETTDKYAGWYGTFKIEDINLCFVQLAFHAQNATIISNIVKFNKNFDFLSRVFCGFKIKDFLKKYFPSKDKKDFEGSIDKIVKTLCFDEKTNPDGLHWVDTKNKSNKKDCIISRYAKALINGALYLDNFNTRKELIDDLKKQNTIYKRGNIIDKNRNMINYFIGKVGEGSGFSVALACDFIKELDTCFDFLAKPDIHIMDVMEALLNKPERYYRQSTAKAFECLSTFQKLVDDINKQLPSNQKITVYQLDRMIWLICSDNFFLDYQNLDKDDFIKEIRN